MLCHSSYQPMQQCHLDKLLSLKLGLAIGIDRVADISLLPVGFAAIIHLYFVL